MDKFVVGYICGMLTMAFVVGILSKTPYSMIYKAEKAITECEQALPRNQQCKLVGVVDESI